MDKKILLVDVDETLIDNLWHMGINEFCNTNFTREEVSYNVDKYLNSKEEMQAFYDFLKSKKFYDGCSFKKDAVEVLKKLNDKYDVYICTSCILNIGKGFIYAASYQEKFEKLQDFFPFISPDKYIFTQNKNIIDADIIIDDAIYNLMGKQPVKLITGCFFGN